MEYLPEHTLFPLVREPHSRWERAGLSPRAERRFNRFASALVALFVAGWVYSVSTVRPGEASAPVAPIAEAIIRSPFARDARPEGAYLTDALVTRFANELDDYRGQSGKVNVVLRAPDEPLKLPGAAGSLPRGARVALQPTAGTAGGAASADAPPASPGIWNLVLQMRDAIRPVGNLSVITMLPLSAKRGGRVGGYMIGSWPFERGGAPRDIYNPPAGLVQVTPENRNLRVSEHLRLGDLVTKGQANVWPKYVVLSPRMLDKVELTIQELQRSGTRVDNIFVISAFRTPNYNESGGDTSGRASLSRHMYGDALDWAVDNNRDGRMDDLNGDGRVTVADARVIARAADRVEKMYPNTVGGIGIYAPTGAHAGFVHTDTRGYRARW